MEREASEHREDAAEADSGAERETQESSPEESSLNPEEPQAAPREVVLSSKLKLERKRNLAQPFFPNYRLSLPFHLLAAASFVLVFALLRAEVFSTLGSFVYGGVTGDAGLYYFLTADFIKQFSEFSWFTTSAAFPYTRDLAWSDSFILPAALSSFLQLLGFNLAASYSLVIVAANLLGAYFTFRLAFSLSGSHWAALLAGFMGIGNAFFSSRLGHPQFQFWLFLPLTLFLMQRALTRASFLNGAATGLCLLGAFLSSVYIAVYSALAAGFLFASWALLQPRILDKALILKPAFGAALLLPLFLPFVLPYFEVKEVFGPRYLYEQYFLAAPVSALWSAPEFNLLYSGTAELSRPEARWFMGLVLVGLIFSALSYCLRPKPLLKAGLSWLALSFAAGLGIFFKEESRSIEIITALLLWLSLFSLAFLLRKTGQFERAHGQNFLSGRDLCLSLFSLAFISLVLSFGPLGNPAEGELALAPAAAAYYLLPGASSLRASARFAMIAICAAFVIVAFAFEFRARSNRRLAVPVFFIVLAIFLLENFQTRYALEPAPLRSEFTNFLQIEANPSDVVLHLPLSTKLNGNGEVISWGEYADKNLSYLNENVAFGLRTVNAYSGIRTKLMREYPRKLSGFPDQRSLNTLAMISNLRWLVLHKEEYGEERLNIIQTKLESMANVFVLEMESSNGDLLYSYSPSTKLRDSFEIRVPSSPQGNMLFELRSRFSPNEEGAYDNNEVEVLELDHYDSQVIGRMQLPKNGLFSFYSVPLPPSKNPARPFRLKIVDKDKAGLTLKDRRFLPPQEVKMK